MSWNYRIVRSEEPDGSPYYEIREAFYHKPMDSTPHSIAATGVRAGGETLLTLRKDLALMCAAFDRPPLDAKYFQDAIAQPLSVDAIDPSAADPGTPSTREKTSSSAGVLPRQE